MVSRVKRRSRRGITALLSGTMLIAAQNGFAWNQFGGGGESELDGMLSNGLIISKEYKDYSGKGYVEGFISEGAELLQNLKVTYAGPWRATIRYSAGDGDVPLLITVDGDKTREIVLPATPDWKTWSHRVFSLNLMKGRKKPNKVSFKVKEGSTKDLHLDYVATRIHKVHPSVENRPIFTKAEVKQKCIEGQNKLKKAGIDSMVLVARNFVRTSHNYDYYLKNWEYRAGGGLYILRDGELKQLIDASKGQILDCELSYDGQTALFSWRKDNKTNLAVYTINIDGTNLTQITKHPSNNFCPRWLPDGGIAFLSDRDNNFAYCAGTTSSVLYRVMPNGTGLKRLSSNYLTDMTPNIMPDGKIMYCRWEYVDRFQIPYQGLWAQNPDGTGLVHIYGQRILEPLTFSYAKHIPGTSKILSSLTGHGGALCGGIAVIDPSLGANNPAGTKVILGEMVSYKAARNRYPEYLYEYPYPVNENYFLVSHDGAIELSSYEGKSEVILERDMVPGGEALGFFAALPVRERKREPVIEGTLPANPKSNTSTVIMQDVYIGLEKELKKGTLKRGDIKQIRIVENRPKHNASSQKYAAFCWQFPVVSGGATMEPKRTVSVVDVEKDGSAMFNVPASTPIFFQALDKDGRVIHRMRTFTQFMPGEVQSCTGCHSDRNTAPPVNAKRISAVQKAAQTINGSPWNEHKEGFSYIEQVQPVLDKHCIECHNPMNESAGLDLSGDRTDLFNVSYDNLVRDGINRNPRKSSAWGKNQFAHKYISYIPSYNWQEFNYMKPEYFQIKSWGTYKSKLADIIHSNHKDKDGNPRIKLSDLEKRTIFAWVDYNVPYYQTSHVNDATVKHGMREMVPKNFDNMLKDVAERRCAECHEPAAKGVGGWYSWNDKNYNKQDLRRLPRDFYLRWEKPELNNFMLAPLAKTAGGTQKCGSPTFTDKTDPDYQKLLNAFTPLNEKMKRLPRMDIPGAQELRSKHHSVLYKNLDQP